MCIYFVLFTVALSSCVLALMHFFHLPFFAAYPLSLIYNIVRRGTAHR